MSRSFLWYLRAKWSQISLTTKIFAEVGLGTAIEPNTAGLCVNCLRNTVDITEEIPKQTALSFCRNCSRYLSPPQTWLLAELESKELLAICLRRLKGLTKVRLIDAGFIWTEPHSKRLRVKLTIQKEVRLVSHFDFHFMYRCSILKIMNSSYRRIR